MVIWHPNVAVGDPGYREREVKQRRANTTTHQVVLYTPSSSAACADCLVRVLASSLDYIARGDRSRLALTSSGKQTVLSHQHGSQRQARSSSLIRFRHLFYKISRPFLEFMLALHSDEHVRVCIIIHAFKMALFTHILPTEARLQLVCPVTSSPHSCFHSQTGSTHIMCTCNLFWLYGEREEEKTKKKRGYSPLSCDDPLPGIMLYNHSPSASTKQNVCFSFFLSFFFQNPRKKTSASNLALAGSFSYQFSTQKFCWPIHFNSLAHRLKERFGVFHTLHL